ncbi:Cna B domain protein [Isosphaera pallida ATCC 43644]|uniref:Cna B domain protein n=1 Tax=Isosphaera pallida (strain ATCC 43644 / DSM 9630 / IS1B) TaxID=575540 RepID=E8R1G1_ISOPI|nr:SdrD B-like domain-containing protein [Isosphaera pallida]ADV62378.1 Cna B domain protein [Isosphaera pallida ATCC 43644]
MDPRLRLLRPRWLAEMGKGIGLGTAVGPRSRRRGGRSSWSLQPAAEIATRGLEVRALLTSSLSGVVYDDLNANGRFDEGDSPIANVAIRLTGIDANGQPVNLETVTGTDGRYAFPDLQPGTYELTQIQPAGYVNATNSTGAPAGVLSGADSIVNIPLGANVNGFGFNFGERSIRVSGSVFVDLDRNGSRGPNETGVAGVAVRLIDGSGSVIQTQTTNAEGRFEFVAVPVGTYVLERDPVPGYGVGTPATQTVTVTNAGLANRDFGVTVGRLVGLVFVDTNNDGLFNAGEPGLSGVLVTLTGTDFNGAAVERSTLTGTDGSFRFEDLLAGDYTLTRVAPAGYDAATAIPGTSGGTGGLGVVSNITLAGGFQAADYRFVERGTPLAGVVFRDVNRNGQINPEDRGVPGVTIILRNTSDVEIARTVTDAQGRYAFANQRPGSYVIERVLPPGFGSTSSARQTITNPPATRADGTNDPDRGQGRPNINFGLSTGSLSGTVFVDANANRLIEAGEGGVAGVTIRLTGTDAAGNPVDLTTTTDQTGRFEFDNLLAGRYQITADPTAGLAAGLTNVGSAGGVVVGPNRIEQISLGAGIASTNYNFGRLGTSVRGVVFIDLNRDRVRDPNENGLAGVTLRLLNPSDNSVVATTTTNARGEYEFRNVAAGNYLLQKVQNPDFLSGSPGLDNTIAITVAPEGLIDVNFPEFAGELAGVVFLDANSNGVRDSDEPGIPGVTITLRRGSGVGTLVETITTDANGVYRFQGLTAGTYRITQTQPSTFNNGQTVLGSLGGQTLTDDVRNIAVAPGAQGLGYDFTELPRGLAGVVFLDEPGGTPGVFDQGERGLSGVTVRATNQATGVVSTAITDPSGQFVFFNLSAGTYTIEKVPLPGYRIITPTTRTITITGPTDPQLLSFAVQAARLLGSVYNDLNGDGQRGPNETGVSGVTIRLTGTDVNGNAVNTTTTTDAEGRFTFRDLIAGTYSLRREAGFALFAPGINTVGTVEGVLSGQLTGDSQISSIVLGPGATGEGYLFGQRASAIRGRVFLDSNNNSALDDGERGIAGAVIQLRDSDNRLVATATTDQDGHYVFPNVAPGTYSLVSVQPLGFASSTADVLTSVVVSTDNLEGRNFGKLGATLSGSSFLDLDANGVRDPNERGLANVAINLTGTDAAGNPVTRTTTTDVNGNFRFTDLPAGNYTVVETQRPDVLPGRAAVGNAGGVVIDSNTIAEIGVGPGANLSGYTFGNLALDNASLTGRVFQDLNGNGVRDLGEPGVAGVLVTLSGIDQDNQPVLLSTVTDSDGFYRFENLRQGVYRVTATIPEGFIATTAVVGDSGGRLDPADPGVSIIGIPLAGGAAGAGYDFALSRPMGSLSGFVYVDHNRDGVRQPRELGLPGVRLILEGTDSVGNRVERSTLTLQNGLYRFENLPAGSYRITQVQPGQFLNGRVTPGSQGGFVRGPNEIAGITLGIGQHGVENNFGELPRSGSRYPGLTRRTARPSRPIPPPRYVGPAVPRFPIFPRLAVPPRIR